MKYLRLMLGILSPNVKWLYKYALCYFVITVIVIFNG